MIRRAMLTLVALALGVYAAYAVLMIWLHPRFIYPFQQTPFASTGFETTLIGDVPVYVHRGAVDAPIVLYFMGNAGAISLFSPMIDHHAQAGRTVVAMGYRGGGGLPGSSSETSLKSDATHVFENLSTALPDSEGPVLVHGYSLGTGLALYLAATQKVDGVILSAPYARMCELMTAASYLPACLLPGVQKWDSMALTPAVTADVLVLHGDADGLIPFAHGERVAQALSDGQTTSRFVRIPGAGHADLMDYAPYLSEMDSFIGELITQN